MELESLFSSTRWEIISALSDESLSPMELAEKLNTTSANISQQLRLLELAGLVKSEKISNTDKGKPRIIYSLAGDNAYLILASGGFAKKRMLPLTSYHKFMMKVWFIENIEHHMNLAVLYQALKDDFDKVSIVAAESKYGSLTVHIKTENKAAVEKLLGKLELKVSYHSDDGFKKKDLIVLYDNTRMEG